MKLSNKKHTFTYSIIALLLVAILSGCSGKSSGFDASRYTKSCLDAMTKAEFKDYIELTKSTAEQAQRDYERRLQNELRSLAVAFRMDTKTKDRYYAIIKDMYSKCKYEVGEAVKGENDSYTVPVTVYKMKLFENAFDDVNKKVKNYFKKNTKVAPTTTNVAQRQGQYLADLLSERLKKPEYADPEKIDVTVQLGTVNAITYTIKDSDYQKLFNGMWDMDKLQASSSK